MKITFKAENGCCPKFDYNGVRFYILEEENWCGKIAWVLKSKRIGFLEKRPKKTNPFYTYKVLARFFRNKKCTMKNSGDFRFYFWQGKQIATDGRVITIQYESNYERPYFDNYVDCLADAKEYIIKTYMDEQLSFLTA